MGRPDFNAFSFADCSFLHFKGVFWAPEGAFSDVLKFSHALDCIVEDCDVLANELTSENAVDLNRLCERIQFFNCRFTGGRQAAIVVKGGCREITFKDVLITPDPRAWCDILIDDWSDQSRAPSSVTLINCRRTDGKPLRVVFGRWHRPTIVGGNVRTLWPSTAGLHVYNIAKGAVV